MAVETRHIEVVAYNPDWPAMFEKEAVLLRQVLGDNCLAVHHIGSTSVPGLSAKENLDILCVTRKLSSVLSLQNLEYVFKGELNIPLRYFFSKNTSLSKVNLHVTESDHGFIPLNLCFRNYLRAHEAFRIAYAKLKEELLKNPGSRQRSGKRFSGYTLGKYDFIRSILDKAGFDRLTVNFCMHDREWEAYHRIRQQEIFDHLPVVYDRNHPTLDADHHYHFVLYKGTRIVCVAHMEFLNPHEVALRSLATDQPCQRQGYGAHMMNSLEKWVRQRQGKIIKLHANLRAKQFYRKLGYTDMCFNDPSIQEHYVNLGKVL